MRIRITFVADVEDGFMMGLARSTTACFMTGRSMVSNFPSICQALLRMSRNPKPSLLLGDFQLHRHAVKIMRASGYLGVPLSSRKETLFRPLEIHCAEWYRHIGKTNNFQ